MSKFYEKNALPLKPIWQQQKFYIMEKIHIYIRVYLYYATTVSLFKKKGKNKLHVEISIFMERLILFLYFVNYRMFFMMGGIQFQFSRLK